MVLAILGEHTTVGMLRLIAKDASRQVGAILAEGRRRPRRVGALGTPVTEAEVLTRFVKQAN